jgi:hypothetical protein
MIKALFVMVCLTHVAFAQPSETPPPPAPRAGETDLDAVMEKVQAEAPTIITVAKGTVRRARRAISFGPTVGLWSAAYIDPGDIDAALTFGIGLETFKVPVLPDTDTLKELVVERFKTEGKQRVLAILGGRQPDPIELDTIVKQVYEDVRREIVGVANTREKHLERPQYTIAFEANRRFGAERWLGRTRVGIGIWKLTFGLSASFGRACRGVGCDDSIKSFVGPEITLHILPTKNPRANVIDVFLRGDVQVNGRGDTTYDQIVIGTRLLVDII